MGLISQKVVASSLPFNLVAFNDGGLALLDYIV